LPWDFGGALGSTPFGRSTVRSTKVENKFIASCTNARYFGRMVSLSNAQIRDFKARAQRLKATLKVGKEGLSPRFIAALDEALKHHDIVKVKFDDFKDQKKELAPQLAEKTGSHLVTRVGNVAVLFRFKSTEPSSA
jgi:RNA-binding protein